jgi:hypothetical protein
MPTLRPVPPRGTPDAKKVTTVGVSDEGLDLISSAADDGLLPAIHEAGHALLSYIMKRGPVSVELFETGSEIQGVVQSLTGLEPHEINNTNVRQCVLISLGGSAAEILYTGECSGNCDDDFLNGLEDLRLIRPSGQLKDLGGFLFQAQKILAVSRHWASLMGLAQALSVRRFLVEEDVASIVQMCAPIQKPPFPPRQVVIGSVRPDTG